MTWPSVHWRKGHSSRRCGEMLRWCAVSARVNTSLNDIPKCRFNGVKPRGARTACSEVSFAGFLRLAGRVAKPLRHFKRQSNDAVQSREWWLSRARGRRTSTRFITSAHTRVDTHTPFFFFFFGRLGDRWRAKAERIRDTAVSSAEDRPAREGGRRAIPSGAPLELPRDEAYTPTTAEMRPSARTSAAERRRTRMLPCTACPWSNACFIPNEAKRKSENQLQLKLFTNGSDRRDFG